MNNRYLKRSLRQNRVSYWDKVNLGCLAVGYRRGGTRGVNITYQWVLRRYKFGKIKRLKMVKRFANITGYPVCESLLFKATPYFGYEIL